MKLLHASNQPGEIERWKTALEDAGINCALRNEMIAGLAPEVPVTECTPELWLVHDEQLPQVRAIIAELKSPPDSNGALWSCSQCGELHESQFATCWKCGTGRNENPM